MVKNLTLAIKDELLLEARKIALQRRTTVNQLVRDYLTGLVEREGRLEQARSNLRLAFSSGIFDMGERTWTRDELYEQR